MVDSDRVEKLVAQILEETRTLRQETLAFRQETRETIAALDEKFTAEFKFVKLAIMEHSREIKDLRGDVRRVEAKLDSVVAEHGARIDKLEGAAE